MAIEELAVEEIIRPLWLDGISTCAAFILVRASSAIHRRRYDAGQDGCICGKTIVRGKFNSIFKCFLGQRMK